MGRQDISEPKVRTVKTEQLDIRYTLARPPRWAADAQPRPLIVHLDQWCWDRLVWDRAGECTGQPEEGAYEFLKDLAMTGVAVFPLSQGHYRENWSRTNLDARWDTAVVMAEISGFNTISIEDLVAWEAGAAVASYLRLITNPAIPLLMGWGAHHCLPSVIPRFGIMDTQTGQAPTYSELSQEGREAAMAVGEEVLYRCELSILALTDRYLEEHSAFEAVPFVEDPKGAQYLQKELEFRELIHRYRASRTDIRRWVEMYSLLQALPLALLLRA
jgi:hypothetical protein